VASVRPDARLVLLGDGPERARIESATARLPVDTVRVAGHRDDVPAWLRRAQVLVLPSLVEGIGGAGLEAMACRLPVVATRVGGLPEAIEDGRTGALVPPGRPAELAAALLTLLADPELARRMGEAGRSRVEARFSAGRTTRRYLAAYRDLPSPR
jgi:glycosyltransferase involved in cell wall biosynthesis